MAYKQTPEGKVLREVVDYLNKKGIFWLRLDTKGQLRKIKGDYRYVPSPYTKVGTPDLVCFPEGHPVFLEIKREKGGRFSPEQLLMKQVIQDNGMEWYGVKSLKEVEGLF